MTFSGKPLNPAESKDSSLEIKPIEVIPEKLLKKLFRSVGNVVGSYVDTADSMDVEQKKDSTGIKTSVIKKPIWLDQPLSFWGNSMLQKQILTLVEYAAPLDQVEEYIRKAYARKEPFLQTTLIQAIQRAVIGLDQTICNESGKVLDEGMADRLLKLHAELFPSDHEKVLEEARKAAPKEDKEAKQKRERTNFAAMQNLFSAFIQNDAKGLPDAIMTFKTFVKNLKPAVITDNQYYLNLLHLISVAFDVLKQRGNALPAAAGENNGQWYGKLGHRFCVEIIGGILENDLPPRVKQILRAKLYHVLNGIQKVDRDIDISGVLIRGDYPSFVLGVTSYFDDLGLGGEMLFRMCSRQSFQKLIQAYINNQNLLYSYTADAKAGNFYFETSIVS